MQAGTQTVVSSLQPREQILRQASKVLLGTAALTASSWLSIPTQPVPITMQTNAVKVVGALLGPRLGTLTVIVWLAEAVIGLPVLAQGSAGILPFLGPTAGYLASFPVVAALVGWLAQRGYTRKGWLTAFSVMLSGNAINLTMGAIWLAAILGWHRAFSLGVTPFLTGALVKALLATATVTLIQRNRHTNAPPTDAQ